MIRAIFRNRRWLAETLHGSLAAAALAISFLLRFEFTLTAADRSMLLKALPLMLGVKLLIFRICGLRHLAWRYVGFDDLVRIATANVLASTVAAATIRTLGAAGFPRSIFLIDLLVCLTFIAAARAGVKAAFELQSTEGDAPARRVLIYGAGKAGLLLLSEIRANAGLGYSVVGFLDDNPEKRQMQIHGARVLGCRNDLKAIVKKHGVHQVLIAIPSATGAEISSVIERCYDADVEARRVPAFGELIRNRVLVDQIREVRLEDLLGRPPVTLREDSIAARIMGRVVLVTGAGGSIGSELCRQIARYSPAALVGFDHAETPLYHVQQELAEVHSRVPFFPEVGSVQSRHRLEELFQGYQPMLVFHAAAYKHVPMMEAHLFEAVENNVFGTANVARAAAANGAEEFVLISSDKAVRPANVMGATKRLAEMVCFASRDSEESTRFMAVRFGNVLGSSGSVIPRFQNQIARGGPVTVTHPEMRRYFMTVPEAVQLVLQAAAMGSGGEIFVLEMGEPVRIVDLARKMVLLSGLRPDRDIQIVYSGVRPGEKMYEEVQALEENTVQTPHPQIRVLTSSPPEFDVQRALRELRRATDTRHSAGVVMCLKDVIPDYNPSGFILKQAFAEKARQVVA